MTEQEFVSNWYLGMTVAAVVVVVVAAIALTLIVTARRIRENARRVGDVAEEIVENTQPIWSLEQTDTVVTEIADAAEEIAKHATEMADAFDGEAADEPPVASGGRPGAA